MQTNTDNLSALVEFIRVLPALATAVFVGIPASLGAWLALKATRQNVVIHDAVNSMNAEDKARTAELAEVARVTSVRLAKLESDKAAAELADDVAETTAGNARAAARVLADTAKTAAVRIAELETSLAALQALKAAPVSLDGGRTKRLGRNHPEAGPRKRKPTKKPSP